MKKLLSIFLVAVLCIGIVPNTASAAVKISKAKATMEVDSTLKLKVNGTSKNATWKTSKKSVATVSKSGTITAKSEGKATITATAGSKKYTCAVTVVDSNKPKAVEIEEEDYSDWTIFQTDDFDIVREGIKNGTVVYIEDDSYLVSPEYFNRNIEPLLDFFREAEEKYSNKIQRNVISPDAEFVFEKEDKDNADEKAVAERIRDIIENEKATQEE
ncbi:MAG: Ig-like domain-containing protein [Lachnospiraceae bacterium]|nr:Ig-like domain-containing protein [Lachnospiraceae bacterium]